MKLKKMFFLALAMVAAAAVAMPTAEKLSAAQELVDELMAPELKALRAKDKTPVEVGEAACKLAEKAEGEAAKWLLLTDAMRFYTRAGEAGRAVETLKTLRSAVKDISDVEMRKLLAEIVKLAPKGTAEPLNAVGREVDGRVRAASALATAEAALKKNPKDASLHRRVGDCQAVLGDWDAALKAYRKGGEKIAAAAKAELQQAWPVEKLAAFWWDEAEKSRGLAVKAALFRKAASFYEDAIGSGTLTGLYKERAEKRMAEVGEKYPESGLFGSAANCRKAGETKTVTLPGGEKMELVWCPPCPKGFMMGREGSNSTPAHKVKLTKGFWIGKYEVTQAQWKSVMGDNPSGFKGDDMPVECFKWDACQKFCQMTGFRLPTEAEWEYACRAGTTGDFAGNLDEMAWYWNNSDGKTHPVGTKNGNAWGIHDMHGNVWEWCQDWYGEDYYKNGPMVNPQGPELGEQRINRGGSWVNRDSSCKSSSRYLRTPHSYSRDIGFRVVCSEDPAK